MVASEDVAAYRASQARSPWLWKAWRAFESAEVLRDARRFDCAANRYYFATVCVGFHSLGEEPPKCAIEKYKIDVKPGRRPRWPKGALAKAYVEVDNRARDALGRAYIARRRADYEPQPVEEWQISLVAGPVRAVIVRAMKREGVPREAR